WRETKCQDTSPYLCQIRYGPGTRKREGCDSVDARYVGKVGTEGTYAFGIDGTKVRKGPDVGDQRTKSLTNFGTNGPK
ncbi:hypothetical protein KI387_014911, partial [Taxus chinensis]